MRFEWDVAKEASNLVKHSVDFTEAQQAFGDAGRLVLLDIEHAAEEARFYCIGRTRRGILTVRFTFCSGDIIRIIGAGYWRKGRKLYEKRED